MKTLLTPESSGSGSCVQVDEETGKLFVQSFDSYNYQRELVLSRKGAGWELHVYQHPGRRHIRALAWEESCLHGDSGPSQPSYDY